MVLRRARSVLIAPSYEIDSTWSGRPGAALPAIATAQPPGVADDVRRDWWKSRHLSLPYSAILSCQCVFSNFFFIFFILNDNAGRRSFCCVLFDVEVSSWCKFQRWGRLPLTLEPQCPRVGRSFGPTLGADSSARLPDVADPQMVM